MSLFRARLCKTSLRSSQQCLRRLYSTPSAEAPASPLLSRLREDLKGAMRSKDAARLSVLRSLLADITNASKTSTPINNDIALLSLLRKRMAAGRMAADEFAAAKREDLAGKEQAQVDIMETYAGQVKTVGRSEIESAVREVVGALQQSGGSKATMGDVMKRLTGPGGALDGKPVEKKEVASTVKAILQES